MPQFPPGETKTAIAPIVAKPSGMACEAELFLGPDDMTKVATSGRIPFVSTGASQNVRLPITMPSQEGTFKGYIDVFAEGMRFLAYKTTEDLVIAPVGVAEFAYVSSVRNVGTIYTGVPGPRPYRMQVDIKNIGPVAGEVHIAGYYSYHFIYRIHDRWYTDQPAWGYPGGEAGQHHILQPGETWTAEWWVANYSESPYITESFAWLVSEAGKTEELRTL